MDAREAGAARFAEIAAPFLERPGVDIGRMFATDGLRIRTKIFAFASHDGDLVVKLPTERIDELGLAHMEMRGRAMREWARVPYAAGADRWSELADEANAFVDSITP